MNLLHAILIVVLAIIVIYLFFKYFGSNETHLSSIKSATKTETIKSSSLSANKTSSNYAYSIWFNVNNWQYRYTEPKTLLSRTSKNLGNVNNPLITLAPYENDININITTYPTSGSPKEPTEPTEPTEINHDVPVINPSCIIRNFPLQKWTNLIVSLNGRTSDIYLDGKLVRTCVLPGVPKIDPTADVLVTPNGGFSGWTSNVKYWSKPLNPQEAYNVYKEGYGSGMIGSLGDLFNKFKIKISYLVNNIEQGSFQV